MKQKRLLKRFGHQSLQLALAIGVVCVALPFEGGPLWAKDVAVAKSPDAALSPDEALARLTAGNQRYVQNMATRPDQTAARRTQLAVGQHPFAIILGCSDSRVAPEIVFDQGLGDLFVVRVAGNVLDDEGIGSLEYAVEHLHVPLIVVLGHSKCGAVTAAVSGEPAPGHIGAIVDALKPAVKATRGQPGDPVELTVNANVQRVVSELKASKPILAEHLGNGTLKIVGAKYDLSSGSVELLP